MTFEPTLYGLALDLCGTLGQVGKHLQMTLIRALKVRLIPLSSYFADLGWSSPCRSPVCSICWSDLFELQGIESPEDLLNTCEACWGPEMLKTKAGDGTGFIELQSPEGRFLRGCRLSVLSMPFEVHASPPKSVQSQKALLPGTLICS